MQEGSQTGEDQRLVISPPGTSAETVQIPEADTSPVKKMTLLHSARPWSDNIETISKSMERVPQEVVNLKGSVGSSGVADNNVYCEVKLRSLSESEIQTVVEVIEESMLKMMGGPIVSEKVVNESIRVDAVGDLEEGGSRVIELDTCE